MRVNPTRTPDVNSKRYEHARKQYDDEIAFWKKARISLDLSGLLPLVIVSDGKETRQYGSIDIKNPFYRIRVAAIRHELEANLVKELKQLRRKAKSGYNHAKNQRPI